MIRQQQLAKSAENFKAARKEVRDRTEATAQVQRRREGDQRAAA